jgi:hypothetical protein
MRGLVLILSLLFLLPACAASPQPNEYMRTISADDRWSVGVEHPVFATSAAGTACEDDLSVETAVQSADMPSSHVGFRLIAGASEADALRVAACLEESLSSGTISISSPKP